MVLIHAPQTVSFFSRLQRYVSDFLLLEADKSVKFISNALEMAVMAKTLLMAKLLFCADISLILNSSRYRWVVDILRDYKHGALTVNVYMHKLCGVLCLKGYIQNVLNKD